MKFSIITNKWANFYFFIQNLSEWHFSNRKEYNAIWRKELGSFSPEEEVSLQKFREIRSRYGRMRSDFEQVFFSSDNPLAVLRDKLNPGEHASVEKIFSVWGTKCNQLYEQEYPRLTAWQELLDKRLNEKNSTGAIVTILSNIYNAKPNPTDVLVYLLLSTGGTTGGGIHTNQGIAVEISRLPLNRVNHAICVVWHEIIHLSFEKQYFYPLSEELCPSLRERGIYINEIAASSLFPRGVLAKKFFNIELGGPSYFRAPYFGKTSERADQVFSLIEKYIEQGKTLDRHYIERMLALVEKT